MNETCSLPFNVSWSKKGKIKCRVAVIEDTLPWYQSVLSQRSRTGRRYILKDLLQRTGLCNCGHCLGKSQVHKMGHQEGPDGIRWLKWKLMTHVEPALQGGLSCNYDLSKSKSGPPRLSKTKPLTQSQLIMHVYLIYKILSEQHLD